MSCAKVLNGLDLSCNRDDNRYFQELVLVNREDVRSKSVQVSNDCKSRVYFSLKQGATGVHFQFPSKGSNVFGTFTKSVNNGRVEYFHKIQIIVSGVSEEINCLLNTLDKGDYFGVLRYGNEIQVFGFEYGLTTSDYTIDYQNTNGISIIELISNNDALEDEPPLIYKSRGNKEIEDFDDLFSNIPVVQLGDFNNDFNNDYYIGQ